MNVIDSLIDVLIDTTATVFDSRKEDFIIFFLAGRNGFYFLWEFITIIQ